MKRSLSLRLLPLVGLLGVYLLVVWPLIASQAGSRTLRFTPQLQDNLALDQFAPPLAATRIISGNRSPAEALAALQARSVELLQVDWDARTGIPRFLTTARPDGRLPYTPTPIEQGNPEAIARGFLDQNRTLFGLQSAAEELRLLRFEPDQQRGYSHIRLDQLYKGLPVFGRQLLVHLDPAQQIVAVNGQFTPALNLAVEPTISAAQAESVALANLRAEQLLPFELASVRLEPLHDAARLVIFVDDAGSATLTWEVTVLTTSPLGQWQFFVNARRPVIVHAINSVMPIKRRMTYTARNGTSLPGRLLADEGERSRDEVGQVAHNAAGTVYDYYFNTFKRDAYDDQGSPMVSTVHYGSDPQDAENAAWIGELAQMIYGDGGRIFRPLPYGLDVVGHEFTHGVIESSASLTYEGQAGALNESYADIFGALIDRDDWTVGEDVVQSPPFPLPYLRSLQDPNAEDSYDPSNPLQGVGQPATMAEYADLPLSRRADNGGVHINSGIPNRAAYLVAQAISREKMEQIYYRALTQYLSPDAQFIDAANATIQATRDLYGQAEIDAVQSAFAQVGITTGVEPTTEAPVPSDTPSGGPAQPAPVPALPAGCSDIIVSGGFEDDQGWTQVVKGDISLIDTQLPRSGKRSAWLGGTDQEPLQYLFQDIRVPANARSVELRYERLVHPEYSGVLGVLSADAIFSVVIANTNGDILDTLEEIASSEGDDKWHTVSQDLSTQAGKEFRLVFAAENQRGNVSSMFVDNVQLIACTSGQGPAAPPVSSQDLVYLKGQVVDADTNRGIKGAQVFVLQPGLTASQAAADDNLSAAEVLTYGTTDRQGIYQTNKAVPRGQDYSVIIVASGYRPIVADGELTVPADAENPYPVDAEMRKGR